MLKSIEIKNFKSIGHAKFDLGKINVLTGQSNLGKSNVVQAIYCLVHNHWDSNYLKWGEKRCSVRLTDETGEWVEYVHDTSSATYQLSTVELPFVKIGRDVPGPVQDFLKMNCVQFDEDLSLDFNFERQFDPSFVISLSGFELAKVFGKIMNLDIVLSASRNINRDLVNLRKQIESSSAVNDVAIEYINSHYPVELKYGLLHTAIEIDRDLEEKVLKTNQLLSVLNDLEFYQAQADVYSEFLASDSSKQIDQIRVPVQGLDQVICALEVSQSSISAYSALLAKEVPSFDFDGLFGLSGAISGVLDAYGKQMAYTECVNKISVVNFDLVNSLESSKALIDTVDQWGVEKSFEEGQLEAVNVDFDYTKQEFNKFLLENNVCPISGKPFEAGCVESIVASV